MSLSKFSQFNTPRFNVAPNIEDHPRFFEEDEPPGPCPLTRQTNDWTLYFGKYPEFCARIVGETNIQLLAQSSRHVLKIRLSDNISFAKREVMHNISRIIEQLSRLGLSWDKSSNKITIFGETTMEFFVCDDSGDFHVFMSNPVMFMDGEVFQPDMDTNTLNQLIGCLRFIFLDRDPVDDFLRLTRNLWDATIHLTLTPDYDRVEFYPEWMDDDDAEWNLPA